MQLLAESALLIAALTLQTLAAGTASKTGVEPEGRQNVLITVDRNTGKE